MTRLKVIREPVNAVVFNDLFTLSRSLAPMDTHEAIRETLETWVVYLLNEIYNLINQSEGESHLLGYITIELLLQSVLTGATLYKQAEERGWMRDKHPRHSLFPNCVLFRLRKMWPT